MRCASVNATELSKQRADAMDYYNGDVSTDMAARPGRSSAVSADVADTIDGLMPGLMEIFAGGDDVVQFSPVGAEDVKQAEQAASASISINGTRDRVMPRAPANFMVDSLKNTRIRAANVRRLSDPQIQGRS